MYNHTGGRPLRGGRESRGAHWQRQGVAAESVVPDRGQRAAGDHRLQGRGSGQDQHRTRAMRCQR